MKVAIAGAHGQIAMRLAPLLVARGDHAVGLIRNAGHETDIRAAGASPVLCDLEHASVADIAAAIEGAEAVVFAAGAGPGSGAERKLTVDRDGAVKLLEAATTLGVPRYVMISGAGVEDPPEGDQVFAVYMRAKAEADAAVVASDRAWTILRPGGLTDLPGTGRVRIGDEPYLGSIPREDVAHVIAGVLYDGRSAGRILYVNGGDASIEDALRGALAEPGSGPTNQHRPD